MTGTRILSLVSRLFLSFTLLTLIPLEVFSASTCTGSPAVTLAMLVRIADIAVTVPKKAASVGCASDWFA
jgi:hypothetical protein